MKILAIDPGNTETGWCVIDSVDCRPIAFDKTENYELRQGVTGRRPYSGIVPDFSLAVIEMVASYGMPVGAEVFETCVWIGRYIEAVYDRGDVDVDLVKRLPVKMHHCHSAKASDANIRQALVDRFALGQPNHGKGTKSNPGWFYGFRADVWAAYALAVYAADGLSGVSTYPLNGPPSIQPVPAGGRGGDDTAPAGTPIHRTIGRRHS